MEERQLLQKLEAEELRRFLEEGTGEVTVLVRVETRDPVIRVRSPRGSGRRRAEPGSRVPPEENLDVVEEVRLLLEREVGGQPNWIGAAKAFVVSVDAKQLRRIAESPLVRAVYPSRRL